MKKTKKLVFLALLVSQALVLSYIESYIPIPVPFPGVKLGLANIISLIAISLIGLKEALVIVVIRSLLSSLYSGGPTILFFSLSGGILSALVMGFLIKFFSKQLSYTSISMVGGVFHNVGQLAAACVVLKDLSVIAYFPVLLLSGVIAGYFVGLCGNYTIDKLKKHNIMNKFGD